MKTEKSETSVKVRLDLQSFKAIALECIKLKLSVNNVGTWLWVDSLKEDDKKQWLFSKGFYYSPGKDKFYLKGIDAISDWGHYTPVQFEKISQKYEGIKLNSKNLNKILN